MRPSLCVLVAVCAALPARAPAAPTVTVDYVTPAPDIEAGSAWYQGHPLFDFDATYVMGDNTVTLHGVWHESALYLAAQVADLDLYATKVSNDSGITWQNDTIELMFDPTLKGGATITYGDPAFRHYIFNIAGSLFDATGCCTAADASWNGTASFKVTLDGTLNGSGAGFVIEMRIPWADLGVTPHGGLELGFDAANADRDDFVQSSLVLEADWVGLVDSFAQPNQWGRLRLAGGPDAGVPDAGADDAATGDGGGSVVPTGPTGPIIPTPDSGCGCRAATPAGGGLLLAGWLAAGLLVIRAARRRRA